MRETDLRALAARLAATEGMVVVWSNADAAGYLKGLAGALGPDLEGAGGVRATDAPEPDPAGRRGPDGVLVPRAFTQQERATAWARANGLAADQELVFTQVRPWGRGLHASLARGHGGVVIDEGTEQAVTLDRAELARLVALLTLPSFAALPALRAVTLDGGLHAQPVPGGAGRQAFVFDGEAAAELGLARLESATGAVGVAPIATGEFLAKSARAGIARLVVNPGVPDERWYDADDLAALARLAPAPASAPEPPLLARARARPTPAAVPPPGRDAAAGGAFWSGVEAKIAAKALAWWQVAEALAFEMDVHVEVDGQPAHGLRWPAFYHLKEEAGGGSIAYLFTGAADARETVATRSRNPCVPLSGAEALRWIVAAPGQIVFVAVDAHLPAGGRKFPVAALIGALLPAAYEIADLKQVPAVGLDRLGRLPGARALRPEAVRALVLGWRNLVGFKEPRVLQVGGRLWLSIASSMDAFFASLSRDEGRVAPDPAGKEPPFARWLVAAAGADGLVLDAAGGAPLTLEPIDLLVLDRWAAHPERQPDAGEVLAAAARLVTAGALSPAAAGRIAADFPGYHVGLDKSSGQTKLLVYPDSDAVCLFTSAEGARRYLERCAALTPGIAFAPAAVRHGWAVNPFVMALEGFTEAWIDPEDPRTGGGLRLPRAAVEAAVARLDETLKPRVPDFVAG